MMDRSFLEKLEEAFGPKTYLIDGHTYASDQLVHVKEPVPNPVPVESLTGIVDYLTANPDAIGAAVIHVSGHDAVGVYGPLLPLSQQRPLYLAASYRSPLLQGFFGSFHEAETFVIVTQSLFAQTPDRDVLLAMVGNLTAETVASASDDGVSQRASMRSGIVHKENVLIKNPYFLAPYRTFSEIEQPESEFILRLRGGGEGKLPTAGLFPADGGAWRLEVMQRIRTWLMEKLPGRTVIA
jgi:hypothetical protein